MKKIAHLFVASLAVATASSFAATATFQTPGAYLTPGNWSTGSVPNTGGGDTAFINAAADYVAGPDLFIQSGGVLQVNSGGSWSQSGGISWIQAGGGSIIVNGGTFSQGTAANIVKTATTSFIVNSGTANLNGNLVYDPASSGALTINGGVLNVANEFQPNATFTMSAGTLNVGNLISFANGPGSITFSGGNIGLNGAGAYSGFYDGGTKSLNFSLGSTGVLTFNTYTVAELASDGFLTNGTIRFNGGISASSFTVSQVGPNVTVALVAVPEPSTYAAIIGLACFGLIYLRRRQAARVS